MENGVDFSKGVNRIIALGKKKGFLIGKDTKQVQLLNLLFHTYLLLLVCDKNIPKC